MLILRNINLILSKFMVSSLSDELRYVRLKNYCFYWQTDFNVTPIVL